MIGVDSIGNLASKKEVEDARDQKAVADMTRAKAIKSLFRMVTPYLTMHDIPMVVVNHTYKEISLFPKDIIGGGCLAAGTLLRMADQSLKAVEDIQVGEEVLTLYGKKKVTHTWNPETLVNGNPICYKVTFDDQHSVVCSENHPFLLDKKDGSKVLMEASCLKHGDRVSCVYDKEICFSVETIMVESVEKIGHQNVYDISVEDAEHYILENGVVTHNTGVIYSADWAFIVGRSQEKSSDEIEGYKFTINVEKSRYVREKAKLPFTVYYDSGISKWSGMLDIALEHGYVTKPKNGWYTRPSVENDKLFREKETRAAEFWKPIMTQTDFPEKVEKAYAIGLVKMMDFDDKEDVNE